MKKFIISAAAIFTGILLLISCEKEETGPERKGYAGGMVITNEGAFNSSNGSVSWFSPDSAVMINNLFEMVNGRPLGDVVQSFTRAGDLGVIVVNNSNKLEIVDMETFESAGTIGGLSYPRYFAYSGNGTGFLSNGSLEGVVYKTDLRTAMITDTIAVGKGPEHLVISGNHLYVANSGGWDYDNTISVIDITTGKVISTVDVGDMPVSVVADRNNDIWVLCRGRVVYNETWTEIVDETESKLVRVSASTGMADREIVIGQKGDYFNPSWLAASPSGDRLFFGESGGLFMMDIDATVQPENPLIGKHFSAAGEEPFTGNIHALEITGYSSSGKLHVYTAGGVLLSTHVTGIAPNSLSFPE